jgi:hypothetical protein
VTTVCDRGFRGIGHSRTPCGLAAGQECVHAIALRRVATLPELVTQSELSTSTGIQIPIALGVDTSGRVRQYFLPLTEMVVSRTRGRTPPATPRFAARKPS